MSGILDIGDKAVLGTLEVQEQALFHDSVLLKKHNKSIELKISTDDIRFDVVVDGVLENSPLSYHDGEWYIGTNKIYHVGDDVGSGTGDALPLTGGTLTGTLTAPDIQTGNLLATTATVNTLSIDELVLSTLDGMGTSASIKTKTGSNVVIFENTDSGIKTTVLGELYVGTGKVYTTENKPTANDVGALPLTGGVVDYLDVSAGLSAAILKLMTPTITFDPVQSGSYVFFDSTDTVFMTKSTTGGYQWYAGDSAQYKIMELDGTGVLKATAVYDNGSRVYSPSNPPPMVSTEFVKITGDTMTGDLTVPTVYTGSISNDSTIDIGTTLKLKSTNGIISFATGARSIDFYSPTVIDADVDNSFHLEIGQRGDNLVSGKYAGIRVVKYQDSSIVDGSIIAGDLILSDKIIMSGIGQTNYLRWGKYDGVGMVNSNVELTSHWTIGFKNPHIGMDVPQNENAFMFDVRTGNAIARNKFSANILDAYNTININGKPFAQTNINGWLDILPSSDYNGANFGTSVKAISYQIGDGSIFSVDAIGNVFAANMLLSAPQDMSSNAVVRLDYLNSVISELDWNDIMLNHPTTLAGYGITDAAASSHVGATGAAHGVASTSVAGFMSPTDKTKLDGITAGANAYVHPTSGITAGTYRSVTVDANGHITAGANPTTLVGYGITDAQPLDLDLSAIAALSGTAGLLKKTAVNTWALDTNTYLTGNQSITITGDATGTGSTAISLVLANSGATAGTYKSVTVDAKGRVTAGTNPTTLSGYGITDAAASTHVGATGAAHGVASTSVAGFMSSTDKTKLDGIATGANAYVHPTGDGNLHVPVTGTNSNGYVLKAGATAGVISWGQLTAADVGALPLTWVPNFSDINSKPTTLSGYGITDAQPLDPDLTAIAGLVGTVGLLKKTAANTWALDTSAYLTGNQSITVIGDATGSGTTSISLVLSNSGVTSGTYKSVTVDAKGRVTAGTNPTTLAGYGITDAAASSHVGSTGTAHGVASTSVAGFMSAADKTKLDGITAGANAYVHPASGITAGTYRSVTVDANGHITAGTNPTTLAGYGITDAAASSHTHSYLPLTGGTLTGALTGTTITATNITNGTAVNTIGFINDIATIRYGGSGAGAINGFNITGTGDGVKFRVDEAGELYAAGTKLVLHSGNFTNTLDDAYVKKSGSTMTGNLTAPTFVGALTGNASTASKWATARTLTFTGGSTGTGSIDGSGNVSIAMTVPPTGHVHALSTISDSPYKEAADVATTAALTVTATTTTLTNSGTLAALVLDGVTCTVGMRVLVKDQAATAQNGLYTVTNIGSASVAWVLTRSADADLSAEIAGAVVTVDQGTLNGAGFFTNDFKKTSILGTTGMLWRAVVDVGNISTLHHASGATAGTYRSVTVNAQGHITAGTNPTTLAGYGITDAAALNHGHSYLPLTGGTLTGNLVAPNFDGNLIFSTYGSSIIKDGAGDNATATATNLNINSWYGVGFGPTISGQTIPAGENAVYINVRNGALTARGTVTAPTFAGALSGNASTASKWATARTLTFTGGSTGTGSIDGSGNVSIAMTVPPTGHVHGLSTISDSPYKEAADVATTAALTVTATTTTLTNSGTLAALVLDGVTCTVGMRVLVKDQAATAQNGLYTVTNIGSASVAWVLTRSSDADLAAEIAGAVVTVDQGTANGAGFFTNDFKKTSILGTTGMLWRAVVDVGNISSLHHTSGVTAGTYRSVTVNAQGHITAGTNPTTLAGYGITDAAASSHTHSYLPLTGGTLTGDLIFADSGTTKRGIQGSTGANDQWFIGGGATASDAGYMEIATGDGGVEPIYVRQYTGAPLTGTVVRTLTLLDASGNTSVPGTFTTGGQITAPWSGGYAFSNQNSNGAPFYNAYSSSGTSEFHPLVKIRGTPSSGTHWTSSFGQLLSGTEIASTVIHAISSTGSSKTWNFIHEDGTFGTQAIDVYQNGYIDITNSSGGLFRVGGNGFTGTKSTTFGSIAVSTGNLHIDCGSDKWTYINYYSGAGIYFGNGASGASANVTAAGRFSGTSYAWSTAAMDTVSGNIMNRFVDPTNHVGVFAGPNKSSCIGSNYYFDGSAWQVRSTSYVANRLEITTNGWEFYRRTTGGSDGRVALIDTSGAMSLNGTVTAPTFVGSLTGNASTASKWATARTLTFTGGSTGTGSIDGSGNVSIAMTVPPTGHVHALSTISDSPYKEAADVATTAALTVTATTTTLTNSGTLAALVLDGVTCTVGMRVLVKDQAATAQNGLYTVTNIGSASVAWVLTRSADADTAAEIAGAVVTVDQGTANGAGFFTNDFKKTSTLGTTGMLWRAVLDVGNISTLHHASGATAGTYRSVTVNAQGHITAGTNPTTLAGYGITDAAASSHTHSYLPLTGGTITGSLTVSTSISTPSFTLTSDIRKKEIHNINHINAKYDFMNVNIIDYRLIQDRHDNINKTGVVAQQLEETDMKKYVHTDENDDKSVDYISLYAHLLDGCRETIKDLQLTVQELQKQLKQLTGE